MEARMQPRSEGTQRCLHFGLSTTPASRVLMYQDHDGNTVHHFNIPAKHVSLTVTSEALVDCSATTVPDAVDADEWNRLDAMTASGEYWDLLNPSRFAQQTPLLDALAEEIGLTRANDPITTLRRLTSDLYRRFDYTPQSTS